MIEENQVEGLKTWLAYVKSMGASQTVCLTFAPMYLPQIQEMYPNVTRYAGRRQGIHQHLLRLRLTRPGSAPPGSGNRRIR